MLRSLYKSRAEFYSFLIFMFALAACTGNADSIPSGKDTAKGNDSISKAFALVDIAIEDDLNGSDQMLDRIETTGCRSVLIAKNGRWQIDWADDATRLTSAFDYGFFMLEAENVKIALLGNSTRENLAKLPSLYNAMSSKIGECQG